MASCIDTVGRGVPYRRRCISQSVCRKQAAVYVAPRGVVNLYRRVCYSRCARTLPVSAFASQNSPSHRFVGCPWSIWSCGRGERPRIKDRNRQPAPADPGTRAVAVANRCAGVFGILNCSRWPCPTPTECLISVAFFPNDPKAPHLCPALTFSLFIQNTGHRFYRSTRPCWHIGCHELRRLPLASV